jgi:hypothetical protein
MRTLYFSIVIFIGQMLMACHQKIDRAEEGPTKMVLVEDTIEKVEPDLQLPGTASPYKTIDEWLLHIIANEKPKKAIASFHFTLIEGEGAYIVSLQGQNTYDLSKSRSQIRPDFLPAEMFYQLPSDQVNGLKPEEIKKHISAQIKDFLFTEKFKHSFLHEGRSIVLDWEGEIWSR